MSSRQEQKQRAREERLAREESHRRSAARRKRTRYGFGGLLGAAAIAAVIAAVAVGIGGGDGDGDGDGGPQRAGGDGLPKLPEPREGDLAAAAKAAGCKLTDAELEGDQHETRQFAATDYKTNPPTSGNHTPNSYEDGVYRAGDTPDLGQTVHTLEHGRINVQYRAGTAEPMVAQLEALVAENQGYHMLMYENATKMPYAVAATAWTKMLGCETVNDRTWDALRTFRDEYLDKGPESVP